MNHGDPILGELPWWASHSNLVLLAHHLAIEVGYSGTEIADAIEKPWKYQDEYDIARMNAAGES